MKNVDFSPATLLPYEIFAGLSLEQIEVFCNCTQIEKYVAGDIILQEGAVGDSILLLLKGDVEISQALTLRTTTSGMDTREKSLIRLSADQHPFFGEMSLFSDNDRRSATVKALSPCVVARIEKSHFFHICNSYPEIGNRVMQNIARVLSQRLKQANLNVLKLTTAFSLLIES